MRCFSCETFSLRTFCKQCQENLLTPTTHRQKCGTLEVVSFYTYSAIEKFLHTKHKPEGYRVFNALTKLSLQPFSVHFNDNIDSKVYVVAVDDVIKGGYAHTALLAHSMRQKNMVYLPNVLRADNSVRYSGKSLQFRLQNPREFYYNGKENIEVILVDDIVTTGTTLQQAYQCLRAKHVKVLFALTLAYVEE